jgi:pilus assembly protein CpaB
LRKSWRYLLAIVAGLAVAAFSFLYLRAYVEVRTETVRLPVAARNIGAYEVIGPADVGWASFPKGTEMPTAARTPAEVVGRLAAAPLTKGWQIDKKLLKEREAAREVRVVAVNVDFARMGGAVPGDLVDVYWLRPEQAAWNPAGGPVLVAQNVLVLGVYDKAGRPVAAGQEGIMGTPAGSAAVVTLAVAPEEARAVVAGAAPEAKSIALVKKFVPGTVMPDEAVVQEEGAGGKAAAPAAAR